MKLLLDANLSWRLCKDLSLHFEEVRHVDNIDLKVPPKDHEIWEWARENNFVIVTNDEDFLNLSTIHGFPPRLILLRTGNQSNEFIKDLLIRHQDDIQNLALSDQHGIVEIY